MDSVASDSESRSADQSSFHPPAPSALPPPTSTLGLELSFRAEESPNPEHFHLFSSSSSRSPPLRCSKHPSPAPSRRASFEWHLDGFDSTVPGAASSDALSSYQNPAYPPFGQPLGHTVPPSPPADRRTISFSPSSNAAFQPSFNPTWEASVPSNSFNSDTAPLERRPSRADRPVGLGLDFQHTAPEHPPSILARPSDCKSSESSAIQYVLSFSLWLPINR